MKKVMVFFNSQPTTVDEVSDDVTTIQRHYPNGEIKELSIMIARVPSLTGDHQEYCVASDRDLSLDDILAATHRVA